MSKLPLDIISDVFILLPVKTLVRFKCLSKPCCAVIDDPDFTRLHLERSKETRSNLNLILKGLNLYTVDFDTLDVAVPIDHPFSIATGTEAFGSCNGLIGLRNSERFLALFNPSTRKLMKLPTSPIDLPDDSSKSGYVFYGFGQDIKSNDYKVVRMVQFYKNEDDEEGCYYDYEVKIYSLMHNCWKKITKFPRYLRFLFMFFYHLLHRRGYGVLANGVLHWVLPPRSEMGWRNMIVGFDLGTEEFTEVPQPDNIDENFLLDVGVLDGCLCMICNYNQVNVEILVMKRYGLKESWTSLLSIQKATPTNLVKFLRPLAYSKDRMKVLLEMDSQKLVWYDLQRKKTRTVKIDGAPDSFSAGIFIGSLISLNDWDEEHSKKQKEQDKDRKRSGKKRDSFLSEGFKLVL
ncbi:hypothetical protein SLEP1_g29081 [Rubroshorea leprosula]|uniref:F-box domain-containing protein n=1 Tax=Rubroshorea leprosula TaxID=152421 RepID=A0AAV5K524_9ROSI|nr:hypothetical protein SLEP1_g29081 [Rubroshorea leprosula]